MTDEITNERLTERECQVLANVTANLAAINYLAGAIYDCDSPAETSTARAIAVLALVTEGLAKSVLTGDEEHWRAFVFREDFHTSIA